MEGLRARLGASDLSGSIQIDLRDTPEVQAKLSSQRLDLVALFGLRDPAAAAENAGGPAGDPDAGEAEAGATEAGAAEVVEAKVPDDGVAGEPGHLISVEPLELEALEAINAELRYTVDEVVTLGGSRRDLALEVHQRDGRLQLDLTSEEGSIPGTLALTLALEPQAGGYRLYTRFRGRGLKFPDLTPGKRLKRAVPVAFDLELAGSGASPHAIASHADGYLIATFGKGRVDSNPIGVMVDKLPVGGFFARLLDTLNPARELTPYTTVNCGVTVAAIEDGVVQVDRLVARTPDLRFVSRGQLDLETEELDFEWVIKPKGITTSLVSITDRFVKLGGTLSEPEVEVKPLAAMTATGLGVATAGASVVAGGLWKGVSGWRICEKALKQAKKERKARRLDDRR